MSGESERLGKYLLLEPLAKGGMGEVYLARLNNAAGIGNFVAIKRVLPDFTLMEEAIDRFQAEAEIGMKLKHPNIVTIFEFGSEANQFFVVMEFLRGQSLNAVLNSLRDSGKAVPMPMIIHIGKAVANALNYARRCVDPVTGMPLNLVHKDISPHNVMIGYEGEIKLIDFGISRSNPDKSDMIEGKFAFMAPEQSAGGKCDHRTDLFALGLVMYEMLTGLRLLHKDARDAIKGVDGLRRYIAAATEPLSASIRPVVRKLLEIDPGQRYQTGHDLLIELGKIEVDKNELPPETAIVEMMTSLFEENINELNQKIVQYTRWHDGAATSFTEIPEERTTKVGEERTGSTNSFLAPLDGGPLIAAAPPPPPPPRGTGPSFTAASETAAPERRSADAGLGAVAWIAGALVVICAVALAGLLFAPKQMSQAFRAVSRPALAMAGLGHQRQPAQDVSAGASDGGNAEVAMGLHLKNANAHAGMKKFVRVDSEPAGAEVFVDGERIGKRTPVFLEVPDDVQFALVLHLDGYEDSETSVTANERPKVRAVLTPL